MPRQIGVRGTRQRGGGERARERERESGGGGGIITMSIRGSLFRWKLHAICKLTCMIKE